jgi:hypothetical protein
MGGFILGIVVGVVINIVTALFSRDKALQILPWLLFYIFLHGTYVLLGTTEGGQQLVMISRGWPSYIIAALIALLVWAFIRHSVERLDYATRGEKLSNDRKTGPIALPQSHNLRPLVAEDSFLTEIPFNTGTGRPIPRFDQIPPTRQSNRYNKLAEFATETIIKAKEGFDRGSPYADYHTIDAKKPTSDEERQQFLAEVLQYYIIDQIDEYQCDYEADVSMPGSGDKAVYKKGNPPPDPVKITQKEFLTAIFANRPSQFTISSRFYPSRRGYWISKGTTITIDNKAPSPNRLNYAFKLHNPNTYLLSFAVTDFTMGIATGLPDGYVSDPLINPNSVLRYRFIIKWHFEYYRRPDTDSVEQEQYTKWAQVLFSSLKADLAEQ